MRTLPELGIFENKYRESQVAVLSFKRYWYSSSWLVRVGLYRSYWSPVILGWKWEQRGDDSRSQLKKHESEMRVTVNTTVHSHKHDAMNSTACYSCTHSLSPFWCLIASGGNNLMQFYHLRDCLPNERTALRDGTSSGRWQFRGSPLSADFRTCILPPFTDPECHLLHYCCLMTAAALLSFYPEGFSSSGTCHSSGYGFNEINILTLSSPHR